MRKIKSNKKVLATVLAVFTVIFAVTFAGCYNVIYEILERANDLDDDETVKTLIGIDGFENVEGRYRNLVKPTDQDETGGKDSLPYSYKYRCPTIVVLPPNAELPNGQKLGPNGRIYVTGDDRFGNSGYGGGCDLPQKASSFGRFSDDNGKNWSNVQMIAHFDDLDMSEFTGSNVTQCVTTGDPTIGRTADNRLVMLSTFGPPKAGNFLGGGYKNGYGHFQDNAGKWYLKLRENTDVYTFSTTGSITFTKKSDANVNWSAESYESNNAIFKYALPVDGGEIVKITNSNDQLGKIDITPNSGIGLYADKYYRVYTDKDMTQPFMVEQLGISGNQAGNKGSQASVKIKDGTKTQAHLFYIMSPFVAWRGCTYTGMSTSDDGGITWSPHRDITYMVRPTTRNNGYWFGSPCGGFLVENGKYAGRLFFSAYGNQESVAIYYTEDGGESWKWSDYLPNTNGKSSETIIVDIPGSDDLIAVSRSDGNYPKYSISKNGGDSWENVGKVWGSELYQCNNEMVSVVPLRKSTSASGGPLYAFSAGDTHTGNRWNGHINIAELKQENGQWKFDFNWSNEKTSCILNEGDWFVYSCIREMNDSNLICVWEGNGCDDPHRLSFIYLNRE